MDLGESTLSGEILWNEGFLGVDEPGEGKFTAMRGALSERGITPAGYPDADGIHASCCAYRAKTAKTPPHAGLPSRVVAKLYQFEDVCGSREALILSA